MCLYHAYVPRYASSVPSGVRMHNSAHKSNQASVGDKSIGGEGRACGEGWGLAEKGTACEVKAYLRMVCFGIANGPGQANGLGTALIHQCRLVLTTEILVHLIACCDAALFARPLAMLR